MNRFEDKVAIVTGVTKAMGRAIALRLGREGARVIGCGRDVASGREFEALLANESVLGCFTRADVGVEKDVVAAVRTATNRFGRLDVVVNNAAATDLVRSYEGRGERPVVEEENEVFEQTLRVNLYGPFWFFKHAIPEMLASGHGTFVNISSVVAARAYRGVPGYSASKGALESLTRQVALDYGEQGIRANVIRLGSVVVDGNAAGHQTPAGGRAHELVMTDRLGTAEDVAALTAFLASDESSYLTGSVVPLDGGGASNSGFDVTSAVAALRTPTQPDPMTTGQR